jgi:hypothetical protein
MLTTRIYGRRDIPKPAREFVFAGVVPDISRDHSTGTNYAMLLAECAIEGHEIESKAGDAHVECFRTKRERGCVPGKKSHPRVGAMQPSCSQIVSRAIQANDFLGIAATQNC